LAFQTPITVKAALEAVQRHDYALPAIQREFVWSRDQICMLFDSLLRGYPIGSFLFWNVALGTSQQFVFYDFLRNYHQKDSPHCATLSLAVPRELTAVLDGQQRLTALNIGLFGSHAEKLPHKHWNNDDAYPVKELHLDLNHAAKDEEIGFFYKFRFLTSLEAKSPQAGEHWYPVREIIQLEDGLPMMRYIQQNHLNEPAYTALYKLHHAVHADPAISYYEERNQELDDVLHIFIRLNSQGTPLSHSDLLLSIATAQWTERDAREVIYGFVDSLNKVGQGFNFSKDLVLKAGLVITDASDIRFRVENFNHANMAALDEQWESIESALQVAARLLDQFGFSGATLSANSVLIPIADYLHQRELGDSYLTAAAYQEDLAAIRQWVIKSLLKRGVWGSGLDTLLARLRRVIREHGHGQFPAKEIEQAMLILGKSLTFEKGHIDDLVDTPYGSPRAFPLLALLYAGANVQKTVYHVDHIFPASRFTRAKLTKDETVLAEEIDSYIERFNLLPNLQLLEGSANVAKQAALPAEWWRAREPDPGVRAAILGAQDMTELPETMAGFLEFFNLRRERLEKKLRKILGVQDVPDVVIPDLGAEPDETALAVN
jgi:hypothetical protein